MHILSDSPCSLSFIQKKKRSLIKRWLASFVNTSSSYVVQHLPEWMHREGFDFDKLAAIWGQQLANATDYSRLFFFIENVRAIEADIEGSFAEVGVYKGISAKIIHLLAPNRRLFLFDTFTGFEKTDFHHEMIKKTSSDFFDDSSLKQVTEFLGPSDSLIYCPGYFPDTTSLVPKEETFAFVHLDADLYYPTITAMHFFYPRLNSGGLMVIHDYSSGAWPGIKQAVDEFLSDKPEKCIHIPDKSGTVALRKI